MFTTKRISGKQMPKYEDMTDEQIDHIKKNLECKLDEAVRIHQEAYNLLMQIKEEHHDTLLAIRLARTPPPLPRMDSNHTGMD